MVDSEKLFQQKHKTEKIDPTNILVKGDFISSLGSTLCVEQPYNQFDLNSRKEYEDFLTSLFTDTTRGYSIIMIEAKDIIADERDDFISIGYVLNDRKESKEGNKIEIINISPRDLDYENLKEYSNLRAALMIIDSTSEDDLY